MVKATRKRTRKVKEVVLPEGEEGAHLSQDDKKAKLESFIEQFDCEVESRLKALEKEKKLLIAHLAAAGRSFTLMLTPEEAEMPISHYLLKTTVGYKSARESSITKVHDILSTLPAHQIKPAAQAKKGLKGYATPAIGGSRGTLWTATPRETPMFDKRLLNVVTNKPSGISIDGRTMDRGTITTLSKANKEQYVKELLALAAQLQA